MRTLHHNFWENYYNNRSKKKRNRNNLYQIRRYIQSNLNNNSTGSNNKFNKI